MLIRLASRLRDWMGVECLDSRFFTEFSGFLAHDKPWFLLSWFYVPEVERSCSTILRFNIVWFVIVNLEGDKLDGSGLQYSQSDGDISQDEVIDYANQEENNQQLSALQEYLSMIDGEDDVSNDETWQWTIHWHAQ